MNGEQIKPSYKRTEVGVIPEDWDLKPLGEFVSYTNGKAHEKSIIDHGTFVVVNSKFISTEGLIRKYSQHCFCPASRGDVLMVMSDVPNGRAIAKCYWVERNNAYTVNQRICILKPLRIDGKLLFYMLNRNPFYLAFDDGAKQTNLRRGDVLTCPLGVPKSEAEQRAIATALSDIDALLAQLDQLITKKRDLKQAAMQQLLTGQTRLPGFSGDWKIRQLGEIGEVSGAGVDKTINPGEVSVLLLNYLDVYKKNFLRSAEFSQEVTAKPDQVRRCAVQRGDIFFTPSSEVRDDIGHSAIALEDMPDVVYSYHVVRLRLVEDWDVLFRAYAFKSKYFMDQASTQCEGSGTRYVITLPKFRAITVRFPTDVAEQNAIATILFEMDSELTTLEVRREKIKALKQGMMQELLTGRIRLI